jgi:hypothetical protein
MGKNERVDLQETSGAGKDDMASDETLEQRHAVRPLDSAAASGVD